MYILIDDDRNLGADIICRTYYSAQAVLSRIKADTIGLDYNLGGTVEENGCYIEGNGENLLLWLRREHPQMMPKQFQLVTSCYQSEQRLAKLLEEYGYKLDGLDKRLWVR